MDTWYELNIRLRMESLITQREGMVAENNQRYHLEQSMAHTEDSFQILDKQFNDLLDELRNHG